MSWWTLPRERDPIPCPVIIIKIHTRHFMTTVKQREADASDSSIEGKRMYAHARARDDRSSSSLIALRRLCKITLQVQRNRVSDTAAESACGARRMRDECANCMTHGSLYELVPKQPSQSAPPHKGLTNIITAAIADMNGLSIDRRIPPMMDPPMRDAPRAEIANLVARESSGRRDKARDRARGG